MIRKFLVFSMAFSLAVTTIACTGGTSESSNLNPGAQVESPASEPAAPTAISDGSYPVQQATYDDGSGEYMLMLLNTPAGTPPRYQTANLQMARLTDEEIAKGQKTYLKVENGQPALYLTEDFRIEYVHNVTETQTNPQTGQQETVVVRRESNFWTPFAGALAGQAIGSLLFRPQYYIPPVYSPGVVLTGYGGYGRSYNDAVSSYRTKYNAAPAEVRNRQTFRTTGQIRRSPAAASTPRTTKSPQVNQGNRSTGSGYGSTDLRRSNSPQPSKVRGSGGFGSSGARRRTGGRRR
jgi:hypothetical protein